MSPYLVPSGSSGACCLWQYHVALLSSQYFFTTSISQKHWRTTTTLKHNHAQSLKKKRRKTFHTSMKFQLAWPKGPNDTNGSTTSTLWVVQQMSGWSCQKGNISGPKIFIADQSNQFFNKLVLKLVITDLFCIQLKQKVLVNIVLIYKIITGTVWLVMIFF